MPTGIVVAGLTDLKILFADRLGVSNPTTRDKLLAAVHELKLFGGPVPDERQFRLNVPGNNNNGISPRTKKRSLPERPPGNAHLLFKEILNEGKLKSDQFRFLENYNPTPPLSQYFALNEKLVLMLA